MKQEELSALVAKLKEGTPPQELGPLVSPVEPVKRKKVAVLGFVSHFKQAPFDDPEFEIWGLNELYQFIPRWDRWFEIHDRRLYENDRQRTSEHVNCLKAMRVPVYMQRHWDDIPGSIEYPLQAMAQTFPNPCPEAKPYFTNSITVMMLLAIAEGFEEMHVYGVDMSHTTEYGPQRPSCEWAIGIAQGRGMKVYLPAQSDLMKTLFVYGWEQGLAVAFDKKMTDRQSEMEGQINKLDADIARLTEMRAQYRGAHQDVIHMRQLFDSLHVKSGST